MSLVPFPEPSAPEPDVGPAVDPPDEEASDSGSGRMSFLDHLDELRKRLVISIVSLIVGILLMFGFIDPIFEFIMRPLQEMLPNDGTLVFTEPTEAFFLYIKVAALAGLIVATPVILAQVWLFVAPGLYAHEKRFAIPFVTLATAFFIGGALFAHYILFPVAWQFFGSYTTDLHDVHAEDPAGVLAVRAAGAGMWRRLPDADDRLLHGTGRRGHGRLSGPQHQVRDPRDLRLGGRADAGPVTRSPCP